MFIKNIAVDFDGTLSKIEESFPQCGNPDLKAFKVLKRFQERGGKVILWTCREGGHLQMAIDFCKKNGLIFDEINGQTLEQIAAAKKIKFIESRKIFADLYIDDKTPEYIGKDIDWDHIAELILEKNEFLGLAS